MISEECLDLPMGKKKMVKCSSMKLIMYGMHISERIYPEGHKVLQTLFRSRNEF